MAITEKIVVWVIVLTLFLAGCAEGRETREMTDNHSGVPPLPADSRRADSSDEHFVNETVPLKPSPGARSISPQVSASENKVQSAEPQPFQAGGSILATQDGVTFEHYFPNTAFLKGDESEILIFNKGNSPVTITASDQKFIMGGKIYEQYSGTWEKFPSQQSWERLEYINIKTGYYKGEPLILEPGQKGKLHWHYQFEKLEREQTADIAITYSVAGKSYSLNKKVTRVVDVVAEEGGHGPEASEGGH